MSNLISRPQIARTRLLELLTAQAFDVNKILAANVALVGLRGYFADSLGVKDQNDFNLYDDAMLVLERGEIIGRYNANTDPAQREGRAMLAPGRYLFYRGKHKGRIDAFRAYPEGAVWPCWRLRNGQLERSTCSHINIHDGGLTNTWSEGCQTLPGKRAAAVWGDQFAAMRDQVYQLMRNYKEDVIAYYLLDATGLI